jgi:hypothetical protein
VQKKQQIYKMHQNTFNIKISRRIKTTLIRMFDFGSLAPDEQFDKKY